MRILSTAATILALLVPGTTLAQDYPAKPITWIVPYPPGGGTDIVARLLGAKMSESMGQPVVIENRPGAVTVIGTQAVAEAEPDGYTIGLVTDSHSINPSLQKLSYDSVADFSPIAHLVDVPFVLLGRTGTEVTSFVEFMEAAKADPGVFNYSSIGEGSPHHLAMENVKQLAGIDVVHIPYQGVAPSMQAVIAGDVDLGFTGLTAGVPHVQAGQAVPLGVSTPERLDALPDVPTLAEQGLEGFRFMTWYGVLGPADLPDEIVARLNQEINNALSDPEVKERLASIGTLPVGGTPEDLAAHIAEDTNRYTGIIQSAGLGDN